MHYFLTFLIIALSLRQFCTNSLNDDLVGSHLLEEEYDIDFRSYPSYGRPIDSFSDFDKRWETDDSKVFAVAWEKACSSPNYVDFLVPHSRSFLLKPLRFSGPCKSNVKVEISGVILASDDRSDYAEDQRHWLIFDRVEDLVIEGGGTINGIGDIWWKKLLQDK
ncbi:Polygalacturonase ADPG1 [Striga hermonthica]|uniref:Polygalacturonase ADPG1 n=1 Tax=Striga hermonthica TaxID=68872 RepID=A0A9N7R1E1_STRHE|nr:Polygalacturonase ADPG1 [Striga hermonthica]